MHASLCQCCWLCQKTPENKKRPKKNLVVIGLSELESNFRKLMQEQEVHAGTLVWGDVRK